jgi:hypothetical protein
MTKPMIFTFSRGREVSYDGSDFYAFLDGEYTRHEPGLDEDAAWERAKQIERDATFWAERIPQGGEK